MPVYKNPSADARLRRHAERARLYGAWRASQRAKSREITEFIDLSRATEGRVLPGIREATDEYDGAKPIFAAARLERRSGGLGVPSVLERSSITVTAWVCKNPAKDDVLYLLVYHSRTSNATCINVYDSISRANAVMQGEELFRDWEGDQDAEHNNPDEGEWELRRWIGGDTLTTKPFPYCVKVFNEGPCKELCGGG